MEMQDSSLPTKIYTRHHQRTLYLPTSPPRNKAANKFYMHRAYHRQRHPAIPSKAPISFTTTAPYFATVIIYACNCVTMTDNPRMAAANPTSTRQPYPTPRQQYHYHTDATVNTTITAATTSPSQRPNSAPHPTPFLPGCSYVRSSNCGWMFGSVVFPPSTSTVTSSGESGPSRKARG